VKVHWENEKFSLLNSFCFGFIMYSRIWKLQDIEATLLMESSTNLVFHYIVYLGSYKENCMGILFLYGDHFLKKSINSLLLL